MSNGWALLGEADKFISVSRSRITSIDVGSIDSSAPAPAVVVHGVGAPNEVVRLMGLAPGAREPTVFSGVITADGTATIELK